MEREDLIGKLEMKFIGYVPEEYVRRMEAGDLRFSFTYLGYRKHLETLKYMLESDVLLLLMGGNQVDGWLPVKMFEYMYAGKPILAVTKDNEASRTISRSNLATIVHPQDDSGFVKAIECLYAEKREKGVLRRNPNWDFIGGFERKKLAKELAEIFEEVTDEA